VQVAAAADLPAVPLDVKIALYRIAQEALNNVVKHSGAARATVALQAAEGGGVELRVQDDGQGFDVAQAPAGHFGLGNMGERAAAVGAHLTIASDPQAGGTTVRVLWRPATTEEA